MMHTHVVRTYREYGIAMLKAPLAPNDAQSLVRMLGHKGPPWLADIRSRYDGAGPDFAVVALYRDQPVSHLWVGPDTAYPAFAVLGHVYTRPEHRRQGLAGVLLHTALDHAVARSIQLLVLGVDNAAAFSLYERAGFRNLHGPDAHGHRVMIRGATADSLLAGRWPVPAGPLRHVPFSAAYYASGVLLTNAFSGRAKLPSLGINTGHESELRLLEAMQYTGPAGQTLDAWVDTATACLMAIEHTTDHGCCRYGVPG